MALTLVTGGAGFIGSHLVEALLDEGHGVRVLDDLSSGRLENLVAVAGRIEFLHGSVLDGRLLAHALRGVEVVYHQAARPSVPRSLEQPLATHAICATGTLRALEGARQAGVRRLIYAGSSSVYGNRPPARKHEN